MARSTRSPAGQYLVPGVLVGHLFQNWQIITFGLFFLFSLFLSEINSNWQIISGVFSVHDIHEQCFPALGCIHNGWVR